MTRGQPVRVIPLTAPTPWALADVGNLAAAVERLADAAAPGAVAAVDADPDDDDDVAEP